MPNVLDTEPMRAFARRAAQNLDNSKVAARLERLAFDALLADPRNFRLADADDLEHAPAWASAALSRGETLHVFKLHRGAAARIRTLARRLADTCKVADADIAEHPCDAAIIAAAREFLDKFGRVSIEVASRKAIYFSRVLALWIDHRDAEPRCQEQSVRATSGRVWRRIRSVSELRAIGREFRNCLARTTRAAAYGRMLHDGMAQFWVLRDAQSVGLMVAMAPAPFAICFTEVRGPLNAPIACDDADLARLARAIGITQPPPPPLPPDIHAVIWPPRRRRRFAVARVAA